MYRSFLLIVEFVRWLELIENFRRLFQKFANHQVDLNHLRYLIINRSKKQEFKFKKFIQSQI